MASVFVPTAETSSLRYFLDMMVSLRKPIMFVGGAGVGEVPPQAPGGFHVRDMVQYLPCVLSAAQG